MKITCTETFERGLDRAQGGMFKMVSGRSYNATKTEHGVQFTTDDGRVRTIPEGVVDELAAMKLIKVD